MSPVTASLVYTKCERKYYKPAYIQYCIILTVRSVLFLILILTKPFVGKQAYN